MCKDRLTKANKQATLSAWRGERTTDESGIGPRLVLVWDVPTRLFHWLIVALVLAAYATWKLNWMGWHVWVGEILLTLLIFRLLWGFFGSETARFHSFLTSPGAAMRHLTHMFRRESDLQVGHNPAGGWMVLLLLALLLGETMSGLYVNNDIADEGPFTALVSPTVADTITALHAILWDVLVTAAALHLLAIAIYAIVKRHNLLRAMLTGRKWLPLSVPAPRLAPITHALLLFGISAAAAALLAAFF